MDNTMDNTMWNRRYEGADYVWTITVNQFVERYLGGLPAGTAIDLGAGEGRNAVWLAQQGWKVTAVDFSEVGLDKARRLATDHEVDVQFVCADATTYQTDQSVDLVLLAYLQLPTDERRTVLEHSASWLRPGGMVFVIAHDQSNVTDGFGGPPSAEVCYDVAASVEALAGLTIERAEVVERTVTNADGVHTALDTLIIATRPTG